MHDLLVVYVGQRLAQLERVLDPLVGRQALVGVAVDQLDQVRALDELHHQEAAGLVVEVVEDADHARMRQLRQQPGLDLETGGVARVEQSA